MSRWRSEARAKIQLRSASKIGAMTVVANLIQPNALRIRVIFIT